MYTRLQWVTAFLAGLGNTHPAQEVIDFVCAWSQFETTNPPGAEYNLLNTTQYPSPDVSGITYFNTFGSGGQYHVLNFPTFEAGIEANCQCLANGYYSVLLESLRFNDTNALMHPSLALQHNLDTWGTGHGLEIASLATGGHLMLDQQFQGGPIQPLPPPTPEPDPIPPIPVPAPAVTTWSTDNQRIAWLAEFQAVDPSVPTSELLAIVKWHQQDYREGKYHGPALCHEYHVNSWAEHDDPRTVQLFAGGRAEWNPATDEVNFYPYH
jgi:hypothetical protein